MDFTAITTAISSIGFPIVMCIIMLKYMMDERASHKAETDALRQSIDNNTIVLEKVLTKLGDEE